VRKIILFALGIFILVGAIFAAQSIIENKNKTRPRAAKIVKSVFAQSVINKTIPIVIPANGTLTAKNRLEIFSEVQGIFQSSSRDFKPGQEYRIGETFLSIDAAEYYATVQAAKSDFYNLITSLMPDLRLDYPEAFPVWQTYLNNFDVNKSTPAIPEIPSENVNYFITGRGVLSKYYNVKNLEQRLGKYRISAPFRGILTEALVTKGTLIRPGQKLGEFIDPSVFELELAIEKSFSDLLKDGKKVALSPLSSAKKYTGVVTRINGKIDQATQTIKVFVVVKGRDLKEGMYLTAQLDARDEPNAIKISRKLLIDESKIFIVRDHILDILTVQPTYFSTKYVVVKGVPDGTVILSKPVPGAFVGMIVKVLEETKGDSVNTTETVH
jgi:multidrug efflux pump subunit AcrA (membrane-fusion protein)